MGYSIKNLQHLPITFKFQTQSDNVFGVPNMSCRLFWCTDFSYLIYGFIIQHGAAQTVIGLNCSTQQRQVLKYALRTLY